jgi:2-dehydropantoate 2-reductase
MAGQAGVLPFLNGIAHIDALEQRFGAGRVLGGVARIAATLRADGVIEQFEIFNVLAFGELDGTMSPRVRALEALLAGTTVDAKASPHIRRDLWLKLVFLGTLAAMNSLLRANVGEIVRAPGGAALLARMFETNVEISRREGHAPDDAYLANYRKLFATSDSLLEASLLRDLERGGLIESDHLLGFLLERCRAHGLDDTLHATAFAAAKAYEQRRAAGRLPRG